MRQSRFILFTKYFLDFMFFSGILVEISLPFTLKLLGKYYSPELEAQYWPMLAIFGLSGICGLIIVFQLRKMMKTVVKRECFVDNNTRSLGAMGKSKLCDRGAFCSQVCPASHARVVCHRADILYRRSVQPRTEPCVRGGGPV